MNDISEKNMNNNKNEKKWLYNIQLHRINFYSIYNK